MLNPARQPNRTFLTGTSAVTPPIRVTIWNEFVHELNSELVRSIYPYGIHRTIHDALAQKLAHRVTLHTATLEQPDHGLPASVLDTTDVLVWWGHLAHDQVADEVVARIVRRIWEGMGLVALHSAHLSKIFTRLMGTSCMLRWRDTGETERLWIVDPSHPIVDGIDAEFVELPTAEMYGEFFDIPTPDEVIMISWFDGGEVFRSACTFRRGKGRIFYFRPGHETFPIFHHSSVQQILANGVCWVAPRGSAYLGDGRQIKSPLSPIRRDSCN